MVQNIIGPSRSCRFTAWNDRAYASATEPYLRLVGIPRNSQILGFKTVLTKLEPVGFVKAVHRHKPELIAALPQFYVVFRWRRQRALLTLKIQIASLRWRTADGVAV